MVFASFQQERAGRTSVRLVLDNRRVFNVFMLKCLQTQCVQYEFDMFARVMTLWYPLKWIIGICCLQINKCARIVLFDSDEGGTDTGTGWHGMNLHLGWTRGQNHMQIAYPKGGRITPGGGGW